MPRLAMRVWLVLSDREEILSGLEGYLESDPSPDPRGLELFEASREELPERFLAFMESAFGFRIASADGASAAEALLVELARDVVGERLPVPTFCEVVRQLDAEFVSIVADGREPPIPAGVVDLWHACDWCDEGWTLDNQPGLAEALENYLAAMAKEDHESRRGRMGDRPGRGTGSGRRG